ncbi:hypothetical protein AB4Y90_00445 [Chryseobacterium sp. 2TAF14]|uniref:hypothetical protein n=1 Tax=Chryseobacterium sp. 2TAF14 TaxID=3233007 RepID=UPI003F92A807
MEKKLLLRLCLILMVAISISSCRTDHLPEQETTYSNSSKFQLTSRRISLNEAKHKEKLVTELDKAEAKIKTFSKTNAHGKIVNYGNGVSIDTDNVIYIENGPDFYTYTFRINRENEPENAPVENLVLSPLSDGSWKEELVTYSLTAQEKQTMLADGAVDLKGKITKELLQSGTYAPQVMERVVCYDYVDAYYTMCSGNEHNHGELADEEGGPCLADTQSVLVITVTRRCNDIAVGGNDEGGTPSIPSEGGGNQGGGGTAPSTQPCEGNGVPSQPQDPNSTIGGNEGCNPGTPTLPNLEPIEFEEPKTDCERLKEKTDDAAFKHKMDSLKQRVTQLNPDSHETSVIVTKYKGKITYSIKQSPSTFQIDGTKRTINIQTQNDIAGIHNHCPGGIPMFSYPDLVTFYDHYKFLAAYRKNEFSMFLVTFKGTSYALRMQDITVLDTLFNGINLDTKEGRTLAENKVLKIYENDGGLNRNQTYTVDMAEKMLMRVLNTSYFGNGNSVFLYQYEDSQWKKLIQNPDGSIQKIPCPQP